MAHFLDTLEIVERLESAGMEHAQAVAADRLAFFALAERAIELARSPGAMFHSSIQRDLRRHVPAAQEDRACRRVARAP